jgi:hypothetical protein
MSGTCSLLIQEALQAKPLAMIAALTETTGATQDVFMASNEELGHTYAQR